MTATGLKTRLNTRNDPEFRFLGLPTLMHATSETTNGAFGLLEHRSMPPGFASPYHFHQLEDEAFYVLDGEMAFIRDGRWTKGGAGTCVFGPRGIPHGFKVTGTSPARMLLLCLPGGFERFVLDQTQDIDAPPGPPDMAKLAALAGEYKIDLLGALPGEDSPATPGTSLHKEIIRAGQITIGFLIDAGASKGTVAVFEFTVPAGAKVPLPHYHEKFDETIYGLEGTLTFTVDGKAVDIGVGDSCFIPRGVVHGFINNGQTDAKALAIVTPALIGPEFFKEMAALASAGGPPDFEKVKAVMAKHGLIPVMPQR